MSLVNPAPRAPRYKPAMPWTPDHFPPAMQHLSDPVRDKAIAIANALLAERMDEGLAIRIGIARAKAWALRRGLPLRDDAWPEPPPSHAPQASVA